MTKYIHGIEFSFKFPYIALLCTVLVLDKNGGIFACFFASFLHEIGHLIALAVLRQKVRRVEFSVFDIKIVAPYPITLCKRLIVVLSGVAMNFILVIFFFAIIPLFGYANLFIGLFNILPVSTLDGGQALELILVRLIGKQKTTLTLNILTVATAVPIFTFGIIVLLNTGYNFSFLALGIYLLLTVIYKKDTLEV